MSLARVHRAEKARKVWTCGKCGVQIKVGEPVLSYSVGFRGREQRRCVDCYPTRAERESSMVAPVYDAMDSVDWNSAGSVEDLQTLLQDVAQVMTEIAGEYESSEMYERNEELQERAEMLNEAAATLESWEPSEEEPLQDDKDTWDGHEFYEDAHDAWLDTMRDEARETLEGVETP